MNSPFTEKELQDFYDLLIKQRSKIIAEITSEKNNFNQGKGSGDLVDMATSLLERELDLSLTTKEKNSLKEIDKALERIKKRTYGICIDTQKPIARDRLLVVPEALRTLEAQKAQEARFKKQKRAVSGTLITKINKISI